MANISVSLPSDGETIDAADYNTPINTIVNEINGNLDNSNIDAAAAIAGTKLADSAITTAKINDASITNAKLATTTGEIGAAWQAATPTWTNLTVGNASVNSMNYTQIGKTVFLRLRLVWGSTTAITGAVSFTLPVAPNTTNLSSQKSPLGDNVVFDDASTGGKTLGYATYFSSSGDKCLLRAQTASTTYVTNTELSSTVPFTWTTSDEINVSLRYEAA